MSTANQVATVSRVAGDNMEFRVLTVGWEPYFIDELLAPIEERTEISFTHGLVGDASRIPHVQKQYRRMKLVALTKSKNESLPRPDFQLLAGLEGVGVPTVKSMVQGDRVLRHRSEREALGYATSLALRIRTALKELQPDVVLASFDSLHSGISLAVAKSLGIPWVALAFPVIPDNLTGFCKGLTPNSLVPITRPVDDRLREYAETLIRNVRSREQKVVAFRAPASLSQWVRQYLLHGKNLLRRRQKAGVLGVDRFAYPSIGERLYDVARRSFNRVRLPSGNMLGSPPEARFIYYPFHMAPESMLDTWAPFYQNQLAFVAQLSQAIPADIAFVVKLHFSDPDNYSRRQLQELMRLPRLHIAHPNVPGSAFIEEAALVVGIQGTSCLEAALRGKPVLIFGDSPYQHFPRTERAKRPDELYEQIRRMLDVPPSTDEEIVEAYAAYMARYMPGRINDWGRPIEPDELDRLADCFRALRSYLDDPVTRANWYNQPPFVSVHGLSCHT
jgi:hypothetical protein